MTPSHQLSLHSSIQQVIYSSGHIDSVSLSFLQFIICTKTLQFRSIIDCLKIIPTLFQKKRSLRVGLRKRNTITIVTDDYLPALGHLCAHLSTYPRSWLKFLQRIICQGFWNNYLQLWNLIEARELFKACVLGWTFLYVAVWLLLDQLHYSGL